MTGSIQGLTFAGHRIDGLIGRGGMGEVYRALHVGLQRTVALKVVAPTLAEEEAVHERFRRECRLAASLTTRPRSRSTRRASTTAGCT